MARPSGLLLASLAVHGGLALGIGSIEIKKSRAATAISYAETPKKTPTPPVPAKAPPVPTERAARSFAHRRALAAAPAEAPPPAKATGSALEALPDFGVSLSGGASGTGISLPTAGAGREKSVEHVIRKAASVAAVLPPDGCDDPPAKPKPLSVPQPGYTPDALSAAVEGKVRVQLTVDETGKVIDVKLIQGLGHGLDEAALQAARSGSFEPARRCGKPTRATFGIAMRFKLPA